MKRFYHPGPGSAALLAGCLLFCMALHFASCSKKSEDPPAPVPVVPVVVTAPVTSITDSSAVSGGTITSDGGATITARGVCWSVLGSPTLIDPHTTDGTGTGSFASLVSGLPPKMPVYVRAYAVNSAGTGYGATLTFTTAPEPVDSVADTDGNFYHVVKIGYRAWFRENLKVTRYRNGDPIPEVKSDAQWKIQAAGARCSYDHQPSQAAIYGNLYNFQAVSDPRGLCPEGWHVPTDADWKSLGDALGGSDQAGGKLKATGTLEKGTGLWYAPNAGATNWSGFTAIPGGYRINYGTFYSIGNVAYFWSASDTASDNAWNYVLDANNEALTRLFSLTRNGFSVRCMKDR